MVDDDDVNRVLARALLEHLGWQVDDCGDGRTALRQLEKIKPYAVLIDISLPDICGIDLCRVIRIQARADAPLLVAYTAMAMASEQPGLLAAGFDDILLKPVNLAMMRAVFGSARIGHLARPCAYAGNGP